MARKRNPSKTDVSDAELKVLREAFSTIWPLGNAAWKAVSPTIKKQVVLDGGVFIANGDPSLVAGFVAKGLLRAYYVDEQGKEFTHAFFPEGSFATAYAAALTKRPVRATFEAIEDSVLYCLPLNVFREQVATTHAWCQIGRVLVEEEYIAKVRRIEELLTHSAAERLALFAEYHQDLLPRLKQIHLASYLGITPESLSRVRAANKRR